MRLTRFILPLLLGIAAAEGRPRRLWSSGELEKISSLVVVATVGEMDVRPNSRNTIPGEVFLTIDIRNPDADVLAEMAGELDSRVNDIAARHGVDCRLEEIWEKPPVVFDARCVAAVESASVALGYSRQRIVSGAGHDACQVCLVAPTSMIFVPCAGGLSHNEAESAEPEDLEAGCNVLLHAILALANP